eukprot:216724-Chlamydomonas_euryale.AAC.8
MQPAAAAVSRLTAAHAPVAAASARASPSAQYSRAVRRSAVDQKSRAAATADVSGASRRHRHPLSVFSPIVARRGPRRRQHGRRRADAPAGIPARNVVNGSTSAVRPIPQSAPRPTCANPVVGEWREVEGTASLASWQGQRPGISTALGVLPALRCHRAIACSGINAAVLRRANPRVGRVHQRMHGPHRGEQTE